MRKVNHHPIRYIQILKGRVLIEKQAQLYDLVKIIALLIFVSVFSFAGNAQWSTAANISPNAISAGLNESMGSCIAVSGDSVHVVYGDRFNTTHGAVFYTRSADKGLTWSIPIAITDTTGNAWNAAIAVNGSSVHVVWREIDTLDNHRSSHYMHSLDGGDTWGTNMTIDSLVADWPAVTVSGNHVYVANDILVSSAPYNTEIFFLQSVDNGMTWHNHRQITFAGGRSEDEAINAEGAHVFMSWNDNRSGQMQIFYKHSGDYGATWDSDVVVIPASDYGCMVSADSGYIDVIAAGAPSGRFQILLAQSSDTGATWATGTALTNDTANTHYYPDMVRDGEELHVTYVKSGAGGQYLHSTDGGISWSVPYGLGNSNITPFVAYTGCTLHVILPDSGHINYFRNPTGNGGVHCISTDITASQSPIQEHAKEYPNPFTSQITIEVSTSGKSDNYELRIFDMYGRSLARKVFESTDKIILDRDNLESGIYFYKVFQNEKIISTGKIIAE